MHRLFYRPNSENAGSVTPTSEMETGFNVRQRTEKCFCLGHIGIGKSVVEAKNGSYFIDYQWTAAAHDRWKIRKDTMTLRQELRTTVISLGACLLASQAQAIAILDATVESSGGVETSMAASLGFGKIRNANINMLTGLFAGGAWTLLDSTNKPSKPFDDVNFLLGADAGERSGEWELSWDGFNFPAYMEYVLVLQSGKQWGAYLFESKSIFADPQVVGGTFGISWIKKNGKIGKLRHATILGRIGSAPDPEDSPEDPAGTPGDQAQNQGRADGSLDPDPNSVPIPGTLALLAIGTGLGLRQLKQVP